MPMARPMRWQWSSLSRWGASRTIWRSSATAGSPTTVVADVSQRRLWSGRAGVGHSRCRRSLAALQHLDCLAGAGGSGGAWGAFVAVVFDREAGAQQALAWGHG